MTHNGLILRQLDGSVGFSLLVWLAGGILSLLGALTYAELAAANPEAGGLYCFIRDAFGRITAFLYGWCLFLVIASGTVAALARAFSRYLGWIFYGLGAAAIFPIRRASPGRTLPYRVPGYPWTPLLFVLAAAAIVGNAVFLAFRDPSQFKNLAVAIVLLLLGLPAYFVFRNVSRKSRPADS